jgi:hypothetical protein
MLKETDEIRMPCRTLAMQKYKKTGSEGARERGQGLVCLFPVAFVCPYLTM